MSRSPDPTARPRGVRLPTPCRPEQRYTTELLIQGQFRKALRDRTWNFGGVGGAYQVNGQRMDTFRDRKSVV